MFWGEWPSEGLEWKEHIAVGHGENESAELFYTTHGASQIIEGYVEGNWNDTAYHLANFVTLDTPKEPYLEDYAELPDDTIENPDNNGIACAPELKCSGTTVGSAPPENGNTAAYEVLTTGPGLEFEGKKIKGHITNTVTSAFVDISQEKGPELNFNTTNSTIYNEQTKEYILNVLYGSGGWLGPHSGAFEVRAKDPGIGLSFYRVVDGGWIDNKEYYALGDCEGIQCPAQNYQGYTYKTGMPNGEDSFEAFAEDNLKLSADIYPEKIKVDATPPHGIKIVGLQNGSELPMGEPHLKVEAADGEGTTKSSGIKSIKVSVDGHEVSGSAASCPEGPCTASTEFVLASRDYSSGQHSLIVTATDNANNVAQEEFTFTVHGASPVSIGPGSVEPSTGQLTLEATDVSLGGLSGVSRTYKSRNLTAGADGPLGPQWAINLGGGEGLSLLPNGSAVLTASNGSSTLFTRKEKGEFESPKGDGNLKLEGKEKESGKGISEYLLTDAIAGTKTKFEQPANAQSITPTFVDEFGSEAGQLRHPVSDAIDSSGNVWAVSGESDLVEKFSSAGTLSNTYGSQGTGEAQFLSPWGIAIDSRNGNVYVTDQGNNRVEEMSSAGSFIKTFGWSVGKTGKAEFEICTKECKSGIAGSGNGQFSDVAGVSVDSSGNVWVADFGNNRIEEFNEKGEYVQKFGSSGKEAEEFEGPTGIAFSGGNLYITDSRNNRVQEFSTAGKRIGGFGEGGSESEDGKFADPYGIAPDPRTGNLYVVDSGHHRVQEFTPAGSFITAFGSSGTGFGQFTTPQGIAVSLSGNVYVVDNGVNEVDEWSRALWVPTESGGPLGPSSTTYTYITVEEEGGAVVEPKEALAPLPAGVSSCTPLVAGCRALTFEYASATTAEGEKWGNYKGHLEKVWFHAYSPSIKEVTKTVVAEYSYDSRGYLRAEWDPRLEHPLKTTYGYDAEGHVTSLTPPGQQPWAFSYGTVAGDSSTGRLLKVTQAHPKASWSEKEVTERLHEQESTPKNTEAPKITGSPVVGVRLAVSNGVWSNSPVVYAYRWEDCNTAGVECSPIVGADNANYTPASTDVGHTLVVKVTATNGGGSAVASSAASAAVRAYAGAFTQTVDSGNSLNAISCISATSGCVVSDSLGKAFYATNVGSSSAASWSSWSGPSGQSPSQAVDCPTTTLCLLADGKESAGGKLYYATSLGGSFGEAFSPSYGVDAISCVSASFCISGQDGDGYFRYSTSPASTSWTSENQGESSMTGVFCLSSSFCAIADGKGRVHVGTSTGQIESSSWKETDVDGTTALNGITCTSTTSCVTVDGTGDVLNLTLESSGAATAAKHDIDGTNSLTGVTCTGSSICVSVDNAGNIFISKNNGETWAKQYSMHDKLTDVSCASSSLCATVDTTGNLTAFNPTGGAGIEGELHTPQPGVTIEYGVPATGAGAPYALSKEEVEKWGQKENPVEGTAIFAADEPQGWPASDYIRATVHYWDTRGRSVNTVAPTKGIVTSEYNNADEVMRTLSADNRAAAVKEGCKSVEKKECKSAEVSEKLDTKTEYNPEESEILRVTGPEHEIKLSSGSEVEAREVIHDYYDEGAQEAEEKNKEKYSLLTRTTDGALLASGEEKDVRTTTMSYGGQEDFGWKLRKPTSTTSEPAGVDLVHKIIYEEHENAKKEKESTGNVIETRAPGGTSVAVTPPVFSLTFGKEGSGNGQFKRPTDVATDSSGNVWVNDRENDRVEKFSSSGSFIGAYGSKGSGTDQFEGAWYVAVNQTTGNVYVADSGNNRIDELNSSGTFVEAIGWGVSDGKAELEVCKTSCKSGLSGSGNGQLNYPLGITVDSHGDIWVADENNSRVEEFSEAGAYLSQFGSKGSGNGQFNEPDGLAIDEGEIYVTDYGNKRVEEFSPGGAYLNQFGGEGSGGGQFKEPTGIAVNPNNSDIYVADESDNRVEEFSPAGKFLVEFGVWGTGSGQFQGPAGLAVNASGDVYVSEDYGDRVDEWVPPGAGGAHMLYSTQFGSAGSGSEQFNAPVMSAIDGQGNVWVTDFNNARVKKFSAQGKFLASYGSYGSGEGQFEPPDRYRDQPGHRQRLHRRLRRQPYRGAILQRRLRQSVRQLRQRSRQAGVPPRSKDRRKRRCLGSR